MQQQKWTALRSSKQLKRGRFCESLGYSRCDDLVWNLAVPIDTVDCVVLFRQTYHLKRECHSAQDERLFCFVNNYLCQTFKVGQGGTAITVIITTSVTVTAITNNQWPLLARSLLEIRCFWAMLSSETESHVVSCTRSGCLVYDNIHESSLWLSLDCCHTSYWKRPARWAWLHLKRCLNCPRVRMLVQMMQGTN